MKCLFINAIKDNNWGGMENWMVKLCRSLPALGDECMVVGRPSSLWPDVCRGAGIPFAPNPFGGDASPWVTARLHAICRRFQPDVAVVKGFRQARFMRMAWPAAAIVVKLPLPHELTPALTDRLTFRHCIDHVIVDSHEVRRLFLEFPWVMPGKITTVHNGVAIPDAAEMTPVRSQLRTHLNLPLDSLVVGASGRLVPHKAFDDAIRALAMLTVGRPHLVLFGDGPEQARLQTLARDLGLADRVHFAGWHNDARRLLWGCDVFLHPSLAEGLPNAVLESMAGAVPVIATPAGGTAEILEGPLSPYLAEMRDTSGMARRLEQLLGNTELRTGIGQLARSHVLQHFSLAAMSEHIRSVLHQVAGHRKACRLSPARVENGLLWMTDPLHPLGPQAYAWPCDPKAIQVSKSSKASVHHLVTGEGDYFVKHFTSGASLLRRLGIRRPVARKNFKISHRLALHGARVVPHLAAGWESPPHKRAASVLVTGVLEGMLTADKWLLCHPRDPATRRRFVEDLARWLAHLHETGIACHDLKYSNILVGASRDHFDFALLDLDNCRIRFLHCLPHDVQRNLHQVFRSFQDAMTPSDALRFMAVYRKVSGQSPRSVRRLFTRVERRLNRHGSGFAVMKQQHGVRTQPR